MKKKNKNCLNCAFCTRNRNNFVKFSPLSNMKPFWKYNCESLTIEERTMLKHKNYSFIGEQKRKHDEWIEHYNVKKEEYNKRIDELEKSSPIYKAVSTLEKISNAKFNMNILTGENSCFDDYEKYGISEACPTEYDDQDYLSCWKQHWNENTMIDPIGNRESLDKFCCNHFYDFKMMINKTLELCDEERKESIEKSRFIWTIIITIATLIIALATLIATIYLP